MPAVKEAPDTPGLFDCRCCSNTPPSPQLCTGFIITGMRKVPLIVLLLALSELLFGAVFPGYDFTFSETVSSDSLMSLEGSRLGLDYTGYGYIGGEARTGIYLRLGFQAPYSSILSLFEGGDADEAEENAENVERSFRISASLGPAFRKFIGEDAIWYMGLGAAFSMEWTNRQSLISDMQHTMLEMDFGADIDIGIRIDVEKTTTLRIGVHGAYTMFSIEADILSPRSGGESSTEAVMIPNIFLPPGKKAKPFQAEGYISLGHTFRQDRGRTMKRYIITTDKPFSGVTVEMDQLLPPS